MLDRADLGALLEQIVLGRYKSAPFGWVPYPRRVQPARPEIAAEPDQFYKNPLSQNTRQYRARKQVIGWPVGGHSLLEVESHLRHFLKSYAHCEKIVSQADTYITALKHNPANSNPAMRVASRLFRDLWRSIEDHNPECPACARVSKNRALRFERALRNLAS